MSQIEQFIQNSIPIPNRTYPINKKNVEKKKEIINDIDISDEVIDNYCLRFTITPWANKQEIEEKKREIQKFIDDLKKELPEKIEKIDELEIILKTEKTDKSELVTNLLLVTELKKFLKHNENSTIKELEKLKKNLILKVIDEIIKNTTHINFSTFIKELNLCVKEFEKKSLRAFSLYIPNPHDSATNSFTKTDIEKKSNYWVSQIVYNMLKQKPNEIIFDNNEFKKSEGELNIILCDDGVFTGMQFYETIYNLREKYTDKLNLHLIIPYMSEIGRDNILKHTRFTVGHSKIPPSIYFYTTQNIKSFRFPSYETSLSSPGNKYLFYFDHKLPDSITTIDMFFKFAYIDDQIIYKILIGKSKLEDSEYYPASKKIPLISNCSIEDNNDCKECYIDKICPVNPYKMRGDAKTEDVKVLSPVEFKEYINTIITEEKSDGKSKRRQSSKKRQRKSKKQQRKSKRRQSSKKQQRKSKRRQSSKKQQRKSKRKY
jgi:hypothetical protein